MDSIEQKALALLNAVCEEWNNRLYTEEDARDRVHPIEALCRAIEQHEAFRQEVSDALSKYDEMPPEFSRFIIAKPDPLVEVLADMGLKPKGGYDWASEFRNTLAQRGGKIVWGEG